MVHRNRMKMLYFFFGKCSMFALYFGSWSESEQWTSWMENVLNLYKITFNFYCQCYTPMITVCFFVTVQSQWALPKKCNICRTDFFHLLSNCFGFNAESVFRQTSIGLLRMNRGSKLETRNFSEMLRKVDVSVNNQQPCNTLCLC